MKGTWETTSGGGEVLAAIVPIAVIGAICYAVVGAMAAIPAWVMVAVPVTVAAVAAAVMRALVRHNRREAAEFTARCAERRAIEAAEREERKRHRLEVAAASAPVINNHVWTREAIEAMRQGYAPTAIVTDAEVIER